MNEVFRCAWCLKDDLYKKYHDEEWGVPLWNDEMMFEFLVLETFQAGLSWYTVLSKRENFRLAFHHFNPETIAQYNESKIEELMNNTGIIRNRLKILATVNNAQCYLKIKETHQSFCHYMWQFTKGKTLVNKSNIFATSTPESEAMAKQLKKDGFKFMGSTVCYAHMQATGMVNDHHTDCFRYQQIKAL